MSRHSIVELYRGRNLGLREYARALPSCPEGLAGVREVAGDSLRFWRSAGR